MTGSEPNIRPPFDDGKGTRGSVPTRPAYWSKPNVRPPFDDSKGTRGYDPTRTLSEFHPNIRPTFDDGKGTLGCESTRTAPESDSNVLSATFSGVLSRDVSLDSRWSTLSDSPLSLTPSVPFSPLRVFGSLRPCTTASSVPRSPRSARGRSFFSRTRSTFFAFVGVFPRGDAPFDALDARLESVRLSSPCLLPTPFHFWWVAILPEPQVCPRNQRSSALGISSAAELPNQAF